MFILYGGGGANVRKSTLLAVLQELLGEYAGTCPRSTLMAKDKGAMSNASSLHCAVSGLPWRRRRARMTAWMKP